MQTAGEWMVLWFLITQEFKMMGYDMCFTSLAGPPGWKMYCKSDIKRLGSGKRTYSPKVSVFKVNLS